MSTLCKNNSKLASKNAKDVEYWITNLVANQVMSKKSANDVLIVLNKILNDAVRWEFIQSNHLTRVSKFPVGERDFEFWKIAEVRRFLGHYLGQKNPPRIFWACSNRCLYWYASR
jgi:hypothetical protein